MRTQFNRRQEELGDLNPWVSAQKVGWCVPIKPEAPSGRVCPRLELGADDKDGDVQDRKALAGAGQVCLPPCLAQHLEARPPLPRWDPGTMQAFQGQIPAFLSSEFSFVFHL